MAAKKKCAALKSGDKVTTPNGYKLVVAEIGPVQNGRRRVLWQGSKATVSIPADHNFDVE